MINCGNGCYLSMLFGVYARYNSMDIFEMICCLFLSFGSTQSGLEASTLLSHMKHLLAFLTCSLAQLKNSWECKGPPNATPPRNKALLRDY